MAYQSLNPATGKLEASFPYLTAEQLKQQLQFSEACKAPWAQYGFPERAALFHRLAELLRKHQPRLSAILQKEMGKLSSEAYSEIFKAADACDYYAIKSEEMLTTEHVNTDYQQAQVVYMPIGCVLGIMPWNFPIWQIIRFIAPTMMAGNVALLKPAENVPQTSLLLQELIIQAGFPEGAYQTLLITNDQCTEVIANNCINAVTLTGSEPAGRHVAATAGAHLKKTVLELGGSDAFIVLNNADIIEAAQVAALSRFANAGQTCIAAKRFIVLEDIADVFVAALQREANALICGDPSNDETTLAPMAKLALREQLQRQVDSSITMGATVVCGCQPLDSTCGYPASILDHVQAGMPAYSEELFGPVASIIRVSSAGEAIAIANDTPYGLAASIWTDNSDTAINEAKQLATKLQVGSVFINALVKSDVRLPFGGCKQSGFGRELSSLGIREFMNAKTIVVG